MQAACSQGGSMLLKGCSSARDLGAQQHITEGSESELLQPLNPNPHEAAHVHFQLADSDYQNLIGQVTKQMQIKNNTCSKKDILK